MSKRIAQGVLGVLLYLVLLGLLLIRQVGAFQDYLGTSSMLGWGPGHSPGWACSEARHLSLRRRSGEAPTTKALAIQILELT